MSSLFGNDRFEKYQKTFDPVEEVVVEDLSHAVFLLMSSRNMPLAMEYKARIDKKRESLARLYDALELEAQPDELSEHSDEYVIKKTSELAVDGGGEEEDVTESEQEATVTSKSVKRRRRDDKDRRMMSAAKRRERGEQDDSDSDDDDDSDSDSDDDDMGDEEDEETRERKKKRRQERGERATARRAARSKRKESADKTPRIDKDTVAMRRRFRKIKARVKQLLCINKFLCNVVDCFDALARS